MATKESFEVPTRFGAVHIQPTSSDHIYVSFSTGSEGHTPLTVRGVEWSGSAHFYLHNGDPVWRIGPPDKAEYERRQSLYMSRNIATGTYRQSLPTRAAHGTIADELTAVVNKWAAENSAALNDARRRHLLEQIERKQSEIDDTEKKLAEQQKALQELTRELNSLLGTS